MTGNEIKTKLLEIMNNIKKDYNETIFQYYFDDIENEHWILHDSLYLDTNEAFLEFIGSIFDSQFHDKKIFNINIAYKTSSFLINDISMNYINSFDEYKHVKFKKITSEDSEAIKNIASFNDDIIYSNNIKWEEFEIDQKQNFPLAA